MIELKQAEKVYGKASALKKPDARAAACGLHATTLAIPDGQITGILGDNGAGKTTLLQALAGILPLTGGSIEIDGRAPQASYGSLVYMTGEGSCFSWMTPAEYGAFLADMLPAFDGARYEKLLEFFALPAGQKISTFSTGQRSRVEIASAFSRRAKYLLLDEPFLGKDIFTRRDFVKLMSASLTENQTVLISTHEVDEVENYIDRAVVLHQGSVAGDWMMDDLRTQGRTLYEAMQKAVGYDPEKYRKLL